MQFRILAAGLAAGTLLTGAAHAETMQITDVRTGFLGLTAPFDGTNNPDDTGLLRAQQAAAGLTDGDSATAVDNFSNTGGAGDLGQLGLIFNTAQNNVSAIEFDIQLFGDGGFFNTINDAGNGNTLAPIVQVTTADLSAFTVGTGNTGLGGGTIDNGDNIWTTVASTNDYPVVDGANGDTAATDAGIASGNTFRFTLATPISNITGIRIVGSQGGSAGNPNGFIGVQEIRAFTAVPEPSSLALLGLGGLMMARRRRG